MKTEILNELIDEKFDDVLRFNHSFRLETDRGCALMAAAYLDEALKELLCANFIEDRTSRKNLLEGQGPLGTFSSKINICFALGYISEEAKHDLHIIRKIRNEFAHVSEEIAFGTDRIADRCSELKHQTQPNESSAREKFTRAVLGVLAYIHVASIKSVKPQVPKSIGMREIREEFEQFLHDLAKPLFDELKAEQDSSEDSQGHSNSNTPES